MNNESRGVVVLAAGKGTRLQSVDIPKVMRPLADKPMVEYTVETLEKMGFSQKQICLVVGFCKEKIVEHFASRVSYAEQKEQKGTAHAAYVGMTSLPKTIKTVMVMGGDDSAFYTADTLLKLFEEHEKNKQVLTLLTAEPSHFEQLGRIVRHPSGKIEIIEKEYLTDEQKTIKEISTGTFVFDRVWFESIFPTMPPMRKLGEFGLPTALAIARDSGQSFGVVKLNDPNEWFGVNTPTELEEANKRKQ